MIGNNELVPMTRRTPTGLKRKQLEHDSKVAHKLIRAWDVEHDSDKVFNLFMKYKHLLSNQRYWETLRTIWIVSGSVERTPEFRRLFNSTRRFRHWFSTPEEIEYLMNEIPNQFTAFRATNDPYEDGIAWTLSRDYAEYYMKEFDKAEIIMRVFRKEEVFAYINRNNEHEILIL